MAQELRSLINDPVKFAELAAEAFKDTDKDGSGEIDQSELHAAMIEIAKMRGIAPPNEAEVQAVLQEFDTDKSGKLSPAEFERITRMVLEGMVQELEKAA